MLVSNSVDDREFKVETRFENFVELSESLDDSSVLLGDCDEREQESGHLIVY